MPLVKMMEGKKGMMGKTCVILQVTNTEMGQLVSLMPRCWRWSGLDWIRG